MGSFVCVCLGFGGGVADGVEGFLLYCFWGNDGRIGNAMGVFLWNGNFWWEVAVCVVIFFFLDPMRAIWIGIPECWSHSAGKMSPRSRDGTSYELPLLDLLQFESLSLSLLESSIQGVFRREPFREDPIQQRRRYLDRRVI